MKWSNWVAKRSGCKKSLTQNPSLNSVSWTLTTLSLGCRSSVIDGLTSDTHRIRHHFCQYPWICTILNQPHALKSLCKASHTSPRSYANWKAHLCDFLLLQTYFDYPVALWIFTFWNKYFCNFKPEPFGSLSAWTFFSLFTLCL